MRHNIFDSIPSKIVSGKDNIFANFLQNAGLYRKIVADYREKSVCNTGILCVRNGYIEKNGFSNVCFFTGKR